MALASILLYVSQSDVEHLLSARAVSLRLDRDSNGIISSIEQAAMTDALVEASETCNVYLWNKYAPEMLQTSNWVNRLATILAAYRVCTIATNPVPDVIIEDAAAAEEKLQAVHDGSLQVPGLPLRRILAPVMSLTRLVPWPYQFRCIRVERGLSSRYNRTRLAQDVDQQEVFTQDIR